MPDDRITWEKVTEYEPHHFSAEASDLQWEAGRFPLAVRTDLGNKLPLYAAHIEKRLSDDQLLWIDYSQELGRINVRVFND